MNGIRLIFGMMFPVRRFVLVLGKCQYLVYYNIKIYFKNILYILRICFHLVLFHGFTDIIFYIHDVKCNKQYLVTPRSVNPVIVRIYDAATIR